MFLSGASMSCDPVIGKKPYCVITQERCETPLLIQCDCFCLFFFFKSSRFMKSVLAPYNKGGKIRQKYQNMESESLSHMNLSLLNNRIVQIYQLKIENQMKTIKNTFVPHLLIIFNI